MDDKKYIAPMSIAVPSEGQEVLCASPVPGGNEGLIYEEW